jgi:plastocyanin
MNTQLNFRIIFSLAAAAAFALNAGTALAAGTLNGTVTLEGTPPAAQKVKMNADPVCQKAHSEPVMDETITANGGKLKDVIVYIKSGAPASPAPKNAVKLDQQGCLYKPHAFAIQAGQPLDILNSDPTLHNVNCQPKLNKKFNIAQPTKGMKATKTFDKPEMITFKCNVHPWMNAYAVVTENPYHAVSDANGSFSIKNLPAGKYTVEAVHGKLGTQTQQITVGEGETKALSFAFKAS